MHQRLSFIKEKGKEIPFIDLSGWKSLEERTLNVLSSPSSENDIQTAIEKSFLDVALQIYKRNSDYQAISQNTNYPNRQENLKEQCGLRSDNLCVFCIFGIDHLTVHVFAIV